MSTTAHTPDRLHRTRVFDLDFVDADSVISVRDELLDTPASAHETTPLVVTPNTDILLHYQSWNEGEHRRFFSDAWAILPDGQPIVWASRLLGTPLTERLCGSDLFTELWPALVAGERRTVVCASSSAVGDGLAESHPFASVLVAPFVAVDDHDGLDSLAADLVARVIDIDAEFVIFCLGHPKDPLLAERIAASLETAGRTVPYLLCLGGSAEMYLGIRRRAPRWVQRLSAEWLFRFFQEPRRLFRRYFIQDPAFVKLVASEYLARRNRQGGTA